MALIPEVTAAINARNQIYSGSGRRADRQPGFSIFLYDYSRSSTILQFIWCTVMPLYDRRHLFPWTTTIVFFFLFPGIEPLSLSNKQPDYQIMRERKKRSMISLLRFVTTAWPPPPAISPSILLLLRSSYNFLGRALISVFVLLFCLNIRGHGV